MKNLGLYVHIPFCISKCPYCDFYSETIKNEDIVEKYLSALQKEIKIYSSKYNQPNIASIYIGGGTPTILTEKQISSIIYLCFEYFKIKNNIEITIESNPATFNYSKAVNLIKTGINRISIGAQSFNNSLLSNIGRIHNKKDILNSYQIARTVGFNNINIDLMFGLPGQTINDLLDSLKTAITLSPEHISAYGLSVEPNTTFHHLYKKGLLNIPESDAFYEMYAKTINYLKSEGYNHYEISNFARKGFKCSHNIIYWKNNEYLGVGASSTSYINKSRFRNISNLGQYINLLKQNILPIEYQETLPLKEEMSETIILSLRMLKGFSKNNFNKRFKMPAASFFGEQLEYLKKQGLLSETKKNYHLTKKGVFLANIAFLEFID